MYIHRKLEGPLREAIKQFPVVLITGSRQSGKSTFLQNILPDYTYISFDDILIRNLAQSDPALFLKTYEPPVIIDEIQYVPALLSAIKMKVDANRHKYGQYILTGSQIFALMQGVSESLAGRIAVFQLYPFSWGEIELDIFDERNVMHQILKGFYPEFQVHPDLTPKYWHSSYLSTYIERDIRSMRQIQDLEQFQRFLILLAARCGQLFNLSEIGKECGISQTTAKDWLNLLKSTSIVYTLEPYFRNLTKRVVKSPKLFFIDTGLLCYLLRVTSIEQLVNSPFRGHIFENMVIMDRIKQFSEKGERAPCYFYRTVGKIEIDLIIDYGQEIEAYEIKFTSMPKLEMTKALAHFTQEHTVRRAVLLNLRKETLPFSNGIKAMHWNS